MSLSCRYVAQRCSRQLRAVPSLRAPSCYTRQRIGRRHNTTDATNSKIAAIVDQISQLTLLETAELVTSLKTRLNIPDMPVGGFAAAPVAQVPAPATEEADDAAPAGGEKTVFTLKLQSFDAAAKAKIIKEIKGLLGLSLVDSKKFVESAPKIMKESVPKEDAEKIIATLKELGAVVVME